MNRSHIWFEKIRSQNFQNYPPILCPPVCNAPLRGKHAPKYSRLICNALWLTRVTSHRSPTHVHNSDHCSHSPLPCMTGPPVEMHLENGVIPERCTPQPHCRYNGRSRCCPKSSEMRPSGSSKGSLTVS